MFQDGGVFLETFKGASQVSKRSSKGVSRQFQRQFKEVLGVIMATPPKYFGGWRGWTADSAAQNLRNVFWEHPVIETSSGVVVVA